MNIKINRFRLCMFFIGQKHSLVYEYNNTHQGYTTQPRQFIITNDMTDYAHTYCLQVVSRLTHCVGRVCLMWLWMRSQQDLLVKGQGPEFNTF